MVSLHTDVNNNATPGLHELAGLPGRCPECGWHPETMHGHAPGCMFIGPLPGPPPDPLGGQTLLGWLLEQKEARKANGKPQASPKVSAQTSARSADECEAWAQKAIDNELDWLERDPPGTRNDQLNSRALRCFRLAQLTDFDPGDVHDALVEACRANGLIDDDGIDSVLATLRSARRKAIADGPCDGPDANVTVVDELGTP